MLRRSNRVRGIAPPDPESPTVDNRMLRNAGDRMVDPPTPSPHEVVDLLSSPESQDGSDSVRIVDPPTPPPHEVIDLVSSPESQDGSDSVRIVDPPTPPPHEVIDLVSSPESQDGSDSVRIVDPPTPPPHEVIDHVSSPESQNGSYTPNVHSDDETRMQPLSQDDIIGNGTSSVVCVDCTP